MWMSRDSSLSRVGALRGEEGEFQGLQRVEGRARRQGLMEEAEEAMSHVGASMTSRANTRGAMKKEGAQT